MAADRSGAGRIQAALPAVLLAIELSGMTLLKLPVVARFEGFAFADWGANLTAQTLLDRGLRPAFDFHYPYGLLPLAVGRVWYGIVGLTPWAYLVAVLACQVAIALGIGRFLGAPWVGRRGVVLAIITAPILIPPTFANLAHGMEAALLVFALAEQARGRRDRALALATLAVLCKPSMAYLAGLALLIWSAFDLRRDRGPMAWQIIYALGPAVAIGLVGVLVLSAIFGVDAVLWTLLPTGASGIYEASGFGFFRGEGRRFWMPEGAGWRHYLGTIRGFWIASALALTIGGLAALARRCRGASGDRARIGDESIATCALLHASFVAFFYASEGSWVYYGDVLLLGLAGMAGRCRGRLGTSATAVIAAMALLCLRAYPREIRDQWLAADRNEVTAGLWATPDLAVEWAEVLDRTGGHRSALLCWAGAGELLFPDRFGSATRFFLLPGLEGSPDLARTAEAIARAEVIVVPFASSQGFRPFLMSEPSLRSAIGDARVVFRGRGIEIYDRTDVVDPGDGGG